MTARVAALVLAALVALAAPPARAGGVVVAFRADAAPFSFAAEDGYAGFLADLCVEAVARAGDVVAERRLITATDRFDPASGLADVVCDPTTITRERAARFDFSPIVFIANASFLSRTQLHLLSDAEIAASEDCRRLREGGPDRQLVGVGMVGESTASASFDLAVEQGLLSDTPEYALCKFPFATHDEGVRQACSGYVSFYFGDVDILRAQVARQEGCAARLHRSFLTYEPYALAIPSPDDAFRRRFISALFGLFADGTAMEFYRRAFGDAPMSAPLEMLFRINAIPLGEALGD